MMGSMQPIDQWWMTILSALDPVAEGGTSTNHVEVYTAVLSLAIVAMVHEEGIDKDRAEKRLSEDGVGIKLSLDPETGIVEVLLTWVDGGSFVMTMSLAAQV